MINASDAAYGKSWFIFFLVCTFAGFFVGAIGGAVVSVGLVAAGRSEMTPIVAGVVGFLVGIPISFFTFRWSVRRYIVEPLLKPKVDESAIENQLHRA